MIEENPRITAPAAAGLAARAYFGVPALTGTKLIAIEGMAEVEAQGKPDLKKVHLFDLYKGPNLPAGMRSLAYRLHFLNEERTMTDKEVTDKVAQIVEHLKARYSIVLR